MSASDCPHGLSVDADELLGSVVLGVGLLDELLLDELALDGGVVSGSGAGSREPGGLSSS